MKALSTFQITLSRWDELQAYRVNKLPSSWHWQHVVWGRWTLLVKLNVLTRAAVFKWLEDEWRQQKGEMWERKRLLQLEMTENWLNWFTSSGFPAPKISHMNGTTLRQPFVKEQRIAELQFKPRDPAVMSLLNAKQRQRRLIWCRIEQRNSGHQSCCLTSLISSFYLEIKVPVSDERLRTTASRGESSTLSRLWRGSRVGHQDMFSIFLVAAVKNHFGDEHVIFQQDLAPPTFCKNNKEMVDDNGIELLNWPASWSKLHRKYIGYCKNRVAKASSDHSEAAKICQPDIL